MMTFLVAAWQYNGENQAQTLIKEDLKFDYVKLAVEL